MYYTWAGGVVFTFFFHSSLSGLCVLEGCVSVCMCVCMCVFYSPCCGIGNSELEHLPSHKLSVASSWPHTFASCSFSKWAVKRTPSTSAVRHIHVAAAGSAWKVKLTGFFFLSAAPAGSILALVLSVVVFLCLCKMSKPSRLVRPFFANAASKLPSSRRDDLNSRQKKISLGEKILRAGSEGNLLQQQQVRPTAAPAQRKPSTHKGRFLISCFCQLWLKTSFMVRLLGCFSARDF